jgi:amino acid permease
MKAKDLFRNYILPISTISGSIIGVGFFSLPYIASKTGFWLTLFYFVFLTAVVLLIHLIFGQISLKTPDFKRFPGFVGYYLGKNLKVFSFFSAILSYLAVLLVYLIVGSQFLTSALSPFLGGDNLIYALIYFVASAVIIYFGISAVSRFEFFALIILFISFILVFIKGLHVFDFNNLFRNSTLEIGNLFLPYGPIIFSLWGVGLIPEAEEMIRREKADFKKIIIISTLVPAVFYVLFTFVILGITGKNTTESALVGLNNFLGDGVVLISLLMGAVITFSAFITHGLNLKRIFVFDLKIKEKFAFIITCFTPLALYLLGLKSFIGVISFIGGILLGIEGILILLMYKKIKGSRVLIYPLMLVFALGILYKIAYFIK